tara:strand:+ start:593 stop:2134 length:1542 start_codon:yes stop_codon:yes gene_type:complete
MALTKVTYDLITPPNGLSPDFVGSTLEAIAPPLSFISANSAGTLKTWGGVYVRIIDDRPGSEAAALFFGNQESPLVTTVKIDTHGSLIVNPGTPGGNLSNLMQMAFDISNPSNNATFGKVLGSDGLFYYALDNHISDSTNRPVTGKNWQSFWYSPAGNPDVGININRGSGSNVWVSGVTYNVDRIFGERVSACEMDNDAANPIAARNLKTGNNNTFTSSQGFSVLVSSNVEKEVGKHIFRMWNIATLSAESGLYYLELKSEGYKIAGPTVDGDVVFATLGKQTNIGPYGTRKKISQKSSSYTLSDLVVDQESGKVFTNRSAKGTITFTLPSIKQVGTGWVAKIMQDVLDLNVPTGQFKWTASVTASSEWRVELITGGNPGVSTPITVFYEGSPLVNGSLGSLTAGQWAYGNNDTLGYNTIYVRLPLDINPNNSPYSLACTYKIRVEMSATDGDTTRGMIMIPGVTNAAGVHVIESDGLLGTSVELTSFGNLTDNTTYYKSWQGLQSGTWTRVS